MSYPYTEAFNTALAATYTQDSDVSGDVTNTDTPMYTKNWLEDPDKLQHVLQLKTLAIANARLLYDNNCTYFYDVVHFTHSIHFTPIPSVRNSTDPHTYGISLLCTIDGVTKTLRIEHADYAVKTAVALVDGLVEDVGVLYSKISAGDKINGQQSSRDEVGIFRLDDSNSAVAGTGDQDNTKDMQKADHLGAPRGPRGGLGAFDGGGFAGRCGDWGNKRPRPGGLPYDG